jgi:hypothetical protein
MEYYGKIVCVSINDLTADDENSPAVMSRKYYDALVMRKKINVINSGRGVGNYAKINYDSLPQKYKDAFVAKYGGSPRELLAEQQEQNIFKMDDKAQKFYFEKRLKNGESIPDKHQEEYTVNASVLNVLLGDYIEQQRLRNALNNGTRINFESIFAKSEKLRNIHHHTLPTNLARLRSKMLEYRDKGYECLISGKFANINTIKITKEAGKQIIALKRSKVPVYNNEQIFTEYNRIAASKGWKPLKSTTTLVSFLEEPQNKIKWADAVYGEMYAKQIYQRKHKTEMPTMRDALWYGDGTKLNLYYKEYADGKLQVKTLQVYEVMDAFSELLLGYHISKTEDYKAQYYAYRMAIERAKHKPFELVHDNQGGHKKLDSQQFFDKICRFHRPTAPHSGQSKTIELAFGRFQAQVLHRNWRFTGQNITAKKTSSKQNIEFIAANTENLYTYSELLQAYAAARETWNAMPHFGTGIAKYLMYENSINAETQSVSEIDMIDMFWLVTEKPSKFTCDGIKITIDKKEYTYEPLNAAGMPDMDFRKKHTGSEFFVKYDPCDMTSVWLCTMDKNGLRNVVQAKPYLTVHRAIQEQVVGDMEFIRQMDIINKKERIKRQIENTILEIEHGVAPEQHGLNTPRLTGISLAEMERLSDEISNENEVCEVVSVGEYHKKISNMEYDALDILRKS